jgi:hypothetical protein
MIVLEMYLHIPDMEIYILFLTTLFELLSSNIELHQ